ncbi:hypothetical protein HMPREF9713_00505 [Myroides odoratimimus CCUG 12700]|uniref:hypothetical protein n=1 Tax=Myroides odoratimimus TaxID=76832 RepID=UPI000353FA67|nr:hypothetical protein [Myroides odoratimimus]EPH13558.1 hypothetical protein HMPREF9713_00505 [Myroides odoratimimus CCUG 12700]
MKKKLIITLSLLANIGLYAQTGIGTTLPTEMLDVNGKIRIRNNEGLPNNNLKELYADANGVLGTFTTVITPQFFFAKKENEYIPINGSNNFNNGNAVNFIFTSNETIYNYISISKDSGFLKINEQGYYNYILNINLYISTNDINDLVYGIVYLECSKDKGINWEVFSATNFQITGNTEVNGGKTQNILVPPTVIYHNTNDLIRLSIKRQRNIHDTTYLGKNITNIKFTNESDMPSYNLTIKKI